MAIIGDEDPRVGPFSTTIGNTYFGMSRQDQSKSKHFQTGGISNEGRTRIINMGLSILRNWLLKEYPGV
ncbi:MAG: hypothetical protein JRE21_10975 [Deltaproteobacteria bacterium]|jgi:hypothetical protein|nr:hypothetical protein [Deltaproteobacteria bacterium]